MIITADWVTNPCIQAVFSALEADGHQVCAVGGCVRDSLLGLPVNDIDLATSATPDQTIEAVRRAGMIVDPIGLAHGTVMARTPAGHIQITSFRADVETFGRHARVEFGASIDSDARRRDFTMNALYADSKGTVIDPLGGIADLLAGHVRFVGDPAKRIAEDGLRILRFFRFSAYYSNAELGIDAEGLAACAEGADALKYVSIERVTNEMKKLLSAPNPARAVASMAMAGILQRVLPGADPALLPILIHLEPEPTSWLTRLAAMSDGAGLRLSRSDARDLAALRRSVGSIYGPAALGQVLGRLGGDAVILRAAALHAPLPPGWQTEVARGQAAEMPVRAADLPHAHGPFLGTALKRARDHWLAHELHPDRAALLRHLGVATDRGGL